RAAVRVQHLGEAVEAVPGDEVTDTTQRDQDPHPGGRDHVVINRVAGAGDHNREAQASQMVVTGYDPGPVQQDPILPGVGRCHLVPADHDVGPTADDGGVVDLAEAIVGDPDVRDIPELNGEIGGVLDGHPADQQVGPAES